MRNRPRRHLSDGLVMTVDVLIHSTFADGRELYSIESDLELWPPKTTEDGPGLYGWALESLEPLAEPRLAGSTHVIIITRSTLPGLIGRVWKYRT